MTQYFSIFKVTKDPNNTKLPDYRISIKVGDEFVEAGACWIKDSKSGKYMSCKLSDPYLDKRKGFEIVEKVNKKAEPLKTTPEAVEVMDTTEKVVEYPNDEINPKDIPF